MLNERDKFIERDRYNSRARLNKLSDSSLMGSSSVSVCFAAPYLKYESIIKEKVWAGSKVLEIGAGTGEHTKVLLNTSAQIVASDISADSLKLMEKKYSGSPNLQTCEADTEHLPFEDASFDFVCCAGSLSYGDSDLVDSEILRVLRPGGVLICVDSLNHNPIYRLNRWIHYLRGRRTRSTLLNMPTVGRLTLLSQSFENSEIHYFGALTFIMPLLVRLMGEALSVKISCCFDNVFKIKKSAFKFVLVASCRRN